MLMHNYHKVGMEEHWNSRNFYGTIVSGNGKSGNNLSFNDVPAERKKVCDKRRNMLPVVDLDEEEQEHDRTADKCEKV